MAKLTHTAPQAHDFSATERKALLRKGIAIIGVTYLPAASGPLPYANGERGYCLNDNGTHRVRTYRDVCALAAA